MDNLITNAVKHNPDGVNVEVRVERRPGGAAIVVADQGVGMDEETRAICSSVTTGNEYRREHGRLGTRDEHRQGDCRSTSGPGKCVV